MSLQHDFQSDTKQRSLSSNVRRLQHAINVVLETDERTLFVDALNEYHMDRDTVSFVKQLKPILNTNIKIQLLPLIRKVIPKSDVDVFDLHVRKLQEKKQHGDSAQSSTHRPRHARSAIHPSEPYPEMAFMKSSRKNKSNTIRTDISGQSKGSNIDGRRTTRSATGLYSRRLHSGNVTPRTNVSSVSSGSQTPRTDVSTRSKRTNFSNVTIMHSDSYSHTRPHNTLGSGKSAKHIKSALHNPRPTKHRDQPLKSSRVSKAGSTAMSMLGPKQNEVLRVFLGQPPIPDEGFGFSIRGGSEFGLGIYVSLIDRGGMAEKQGLQPGDMIMEVNDISFKKITHDEAVKIIKAARRLELVVCRVGRIPGSFEVHQMYKWVDPCGRPVSPPPELEQIIKAEGGSTAGRKSGLLLLKGTDERKVNISVEEGDILGLMIRGGLEFGLGIYISGVDQKSVAENAGLKVGDQIIDVNGQSFLDITHAEAVRVLKTSRLMMLTIKDVGKLPFARTTIDKTQWINKDQMKKPRSLASSQLSKSTATLSSSSTLTPTMGFSKGPGSQLMLSSLATSKWDMIEEVAKHQLNSTEQGTLRYYLNEYQKDQITIEGLVLALSDLLNTHAKFSVMLEIRSIVQAKDLDKFDTLIHKRELESKQARPIDLFKAENFSQNSHDGSSQASHHSNRKKKKRVAPRPPIESDSSSYPSEDTPTNTPRHPPYSNGYSMTDAPRPASRGSSHSHKVVTESDLEALRLAIEQINEDPEEMPDVLPQANDRMRQMASVHVNAVTDLSPLPSSSSVGSLNRLRGPAPVPGPSSLASPEERLSVLTDARYQYRDFLSPVEQRSDITRSDSPRPRSRGPHSVYSRPSSPGISIRSSPATRPRSPGFLTNPLYRQSMEDIRYTSSSLNKRQSTSSHDLRSGSEMLAVAEIHHFRNTKSSDNHSPDDDSGVELNGSSRHDNSLQNDRVTVSSDHPVDIDDALSAKSSSTFDRHEAPPSWSQDTDIMELNFDEEAMLITAAREKYGNIPLEVISIHKTKPTLGLAIEGGANTRQPLPRVINIQPGGSAHESGRLKTGQVILEVNGQSLAGMQHITAARTIAEAFKYMSTDHMELLVTESNVELLRTSE